MRSLRWLIVLSALLTLVPVQRTHAFLNHLFGDYAPRCVVAGTPVTLSYNGDAAPGEVIKLSYALYPMGATPPLTPLPDAVADANGLFSGSFSVIAPAAGFYNYYIVGTTPQTSAGASNAMEIYESPEACGPVPAPAQPAEPQQANVIFTQDAVELSDGVLEINVQARNIGQGEGAATALLSYDPASVQVLDAWSEEVRDSDWVSARDDAAGTLTLAFGTIQPANTATMTVRFLLLDRSAASAIRVVRDDEHDHANPIFLAPDQDPVAPLVLEATRLDDGSMQISGKGYRAEELLAIWGNTADGQVVAISDWHHSANDADGTLDLIVWPPDSTITSIVVRGQLSEATGVAELK